jgi:hypothetical protein
MCGCGVRSRSKGTRARGAWWDMGRISSICMCVCVDSGAENEMEEMRVMEIRLWEMGRDVEEVKGRVGTNLFV